MEFSIEHGRATLVIVGYETFAKVDGQFKTAVLADAKSREITGSIEDLKIASPLEALAIIPKIKTESSTDSRLIYATYVYSPKDTVKILAFYLTPGTDKSYAWVDLARTISKTIAPGTGKPLPTVPRREVLGMEDWRVELEYSKEFTLVLQESDDNIRYRFRQLTPLGKDTGYCDIYFNSPVMMEPNANATIVQARLWDSTSAWKTWSVGKNSHSVATARISDQWLVNLHCSAPSSSKALMELRGAMEKLRPLRGVQP